MAPNQTQPGRGKLNSYISAAQRDIKEADQLISKAIRDKNSKPKDFTKKILSTINHVIPVLDAVADVHPAVGIVVSTFKQICKLETERAANDDRIVVMHYTASLSMFSLQYVDRLDTLESMEQAFKSLLNKFDETLKAFGNFVFIYYNQKQSLVRLLHAGKYKKQLEEFSSDFLSYRDELQNMVGMHTALKADDIQAQLYNVDGKLDNILTTLEKAPSQKEREAAEIIAKNGAENIIRNDRLLREVATKLGEKLNGSVRVALREDISKQMADNQEQFSQKIEAAKESIEEAVKASRDAVLLHLNQGPHELIKDDDIKAVWKNMKWRNSVKCRVFVDAIHDHYTDKFGKYLEDNGDDHEDQWTLQILSKVVFHSTIGDAIDEDSSGFVSVTEVNQFLERRPKSWSVPEWLALYREKIHERLDEIKSEATDLAKKLDDDDDKEALKEPIDLISDFVEALIRPGDDNDDEDDDFDEDGDQLGRLQYEFEEAEEERLSTKLKEIEIDAPSDVVAIIGQPRIELSLRPLLYVWLGRVQEQLQAYMSGVGSGDAEDGDGNGDAEDSGGNGDTKDDDGTGEVEEDDENGDAEDFGETGFIGHIAIIGYMVNSRLAELTRVWRQQRTSAASQVLCFCGGVFSSWYEEREKSESVLQRLLSSAYGDYWEDSEEDIDDPDDDQSDNEGAAPTVVTTKSTKSPARKKPLRGDIDQKLQQVWTRMDGFDDRLGTIETLLRSLIAASANTSFANPVPPKKQLRSQVSQSQVPSPPVTPASKGKAARSSSSQVSQRHDHIDEEEGDQDDDQGNHGQHSMYIDDSHDDRNYHIAGDASSGRDRYEVNDEDEDGDEHDDEDDSGSEADGRVDGRPYNPHQIVGGRGIAGHQYQGYQDEDDDHAVQQRSRENNSDDDDGEEESSENANSGSDGGLWPF
ncbi:hypothetical protein EWM64_g3042 [Hericium alpestre]|uniref:EF-hand domain-containing protein n=1 Tax=Hericium alpestre TaxID=135208 RepID=A0A4Z0A5J8_9AGAM|nr:hypothetical protein EWM64_g3042 [Hericium alpestre]